MAFAVEVIPDEANLFRRIHRNHYDVQKETISSAAFKQERMSVDWEKYREPAGSADEKSAAVAAINCGACKALGQTVEHTPIEPEEEFGPNQAHAEVCGDKKGAVSHQLRDGARIVWLRAADH